MNTNYAMWMAVTAKDPASRQTVTQILADLGVAFEVSEITEFGAAHWLFTMAVDDGDEATAQTELLAEQKIAFSARRQTELLSAESGQVDAWSGRVPAHLRRGDRPSACSPPDAIERPAPVPRGAGADTEQHRMMGVSNV